MNECEIEQKIYFYIKDQNVKSIKNMLINYIKNVKKCQLFINKLVSNKCQLFINKQTNKRQLFINKQTNMCLTNVNFFLF